MSLYKYVIVFGVCTLFCWVAWFFVLLLMNPTTDGLLALVLFYLSLSLALVGTFSILGGIFRLAVLRKNEIPHRGMNIASRQSVLFTILIIASLILQSQDYLTWWILLTLIFVLSFVELFFVSYKRFNRN